jgi:hypothetical protein
MTLFAAERLHKRFGHQVVLEDITLAFEEGEGPASWAPTAPARPPASTC